MARVALIRVAFTALIAEGSALYLSSGGVFCEKSMMPYVAFDYVHPNECYLYCVPIGVCESLLDQGVFDQWGIRMQGNCFEQGFTESSRYGFKAFLPPNLMEPCKGMRFMRFKRTKENDNSSFDANGKTPPALPNVQFIPRTSSTTPLPAPNTPLLPAPDTPPALPNVQFIPRASPTTPLPVPTTPLPEMKEYEAVCKEGMQSYESINKDWPGVCSVFCVPIGECSFQLLPGKQLSFLGIHQQGNCLSKGYRERAPLGVVTQNTQKILQSLKGPCEGMSIMKFQNPKRRSESVFCGNGMTSYVSYTNHAQECSLFCVPIGICENLVVSGPLRYLGIHMRGNCLLQGFTENSPYGAMASDLHEQLNSLEGPCKGMTFTKFRRPTTALPTMAPPTSPTPAPAATSNESASNEITLSSTCEMGLEPYAVIHKHHPALCSVFCMPSSKCNDYVQAEEFGKFEITGRGDCTGRGYIEKAEPVDINHIIQGPCQGLTHVEYQKPRICGKEMQPYDSISKTLGFCYVFCVPVGMCQGEVQTGKFKQFGITGEGNCENKGYTVKQPADVVSMSTANYFRTLQSPCRNITVTKFRHPTYP